MARCLAHYAVTHHRSRPHRCVVAHCRVTARCRSMARCRSIARCRVTAHGRSMVCRGVMAGCRSLVCHHVMARRRSRARHCVLAYRSVTIQSHVIALRRMLSRYCSRARHSVKTPHRTTRAHVMPHHLMAHRYSTAHRRSVVQTALLRSKGGKVPHSALRHRLARLRWTCMPCMSKSLTPLTHLARLLHCHCIVAQSHWRRVACAVVLIIACLAGSSRPVAPLKHLHLSTLPVELLAAAHLMIAQHCSKRGAQHVTIACRARWPIVAVTWRAVWLVTIACCVGRLAVCAV